MAAPNPSPSKHKRRSLADLFPGLDITGSGSPSSSKSPARSVRAGLQGTFGRGWPPSLRLPSMSTDSNASSFTIGMSSDYRFYDDKWRLDRSQKDKAVDVSVRFGTVRRFMEEMHQVVAKGKTQAQEALLELTVEEMARAVFASNERVGSGPGLGSGSTPGAGMGLDETYKICMKIFNGEIFDYSERSKDYQARLDKYINHDVDSNNPEERKVARSRREVVQHAAALQHLVQQFVKDNKDLTEDLIKETHKIMMDGLSGDDAGVVSSKSFAGTYRADKERAFVGGSHEFPKPSEIPKQMQSMVDRLKSDLAEAVQRDQLDPFALAAKYCDRFVNIHPFKDGNGRMCRLILNVILMRYAGIIISVGEKGENRQEYINIAVESRQVGGHYVQLASMVLHNAEETMKRWKKTLQYKMSRKTQ